MKQNRNSHLVLTIRLQELVLTCEMQRRTSTVPDKAQSVAWIKQEEAVSCSQQFLLKVPLYHPDRLIIFGLSCVENVPSENGSPTCSGSWPSRRLLPSARARYAETNPLFPGSPCIKEVIPGKSDPDVATSLREQPHRIPPSSATDLRPLAPEPGAPDVRLPLAPKATRAGRVADPACLHLTP